MDVNSVKRSIKGRFSFLFITQSCRHGAKAKENKKNAEAVEERVVVATTATVIYDCAACSVHVAPFTQRQRFNRELNEAPPLPSWPTSITAQPRTSTISSVSRNIYQFTNKTLNCASKTWAYTLLSGDCKSAILYAHHYS